MANALIFTSGIAIVSMPHGYSRHAVRAAFSAIAGLLVGFCNTVNIPSDRRCNHCDDHHCDGCNNSSTSELIGCLKVTDTCHQNVLLTINLVYVKKFRSEWRR